MATRNSEQSHAGYNSADTIIRRDVVNQTRPWRSGEREVQKSGRSKVRRGAPWQCTWCMVQRASHTAQHYGSNHRRKTKYTGATTATLVTNAVISCNSGLGHRLRRTAGKEGGRAITSGECSWKQLEPGVVTVHDHTHAPLTKP